MSLTPPDLIARALVAAAVLALLALPAAAQDATANSARDGIDSGSVSSPAGNLNPIARHHASAQLLRDSVVALARAQVGARYRFGGRSPRRGFDCSGLVQYVMAAFDHDVPRTAAQQASAGLEVDRDTSELRPGDVLTFGGGRKASHVGIYIGNGRYVHASSVAGRVVESPIERRAARVKPWRGARRVLTVPEESAR